MRENNKTIIPLQFIYLSISILSSLSVYYNFYVIKCSNIVGIMCIIDFYFTKKKDMIFHHIFVLIMLLYMNTHPDIMIREKIVSIILGTEVSTIFLINNTLLSTLIVPHDKMIITKLINNFKNANKGCFVFTFIYFRIYKYYSSLIIDKDVNMVLWEHSKNILEFSEIYIGIYGLFILNLYWVYLILMKIFCSGSGPGKGSYKSIKSCNEAK